MRAAPFLAVPLFMLSVACAGCAGQSSAAPATTTTVTATGSGTPTVTPAPSPTPTTHTSIVPTASDGCLTSGLSLHLGAGQGTAGSIYEPIVFTNTSGRSCTLYGYPGVSFVAPGTGHQVGAAASRNPEHAPATVTLAPGASASALLQVVDDRNFPPSSCHLVAVSGLRVYPPGNTAAAYLPFKAPSTACSTQVQQLTVQATVTGSTGQ
jgi:Protein of unknown function (DUF4232)